jgi:hypothetical protein
VRRTRNESIELEAKKEKAVSEFGCNTKKDTGSRKRALLEE